MEHESLWKEYSPTARGVEEHFQDLGLKLEDFKDKKILDIGSGLNQFAFELRKLISGVDITSFDPFYLLSREEREKVYERGYEDGPEKLKELLDQLEDTEIASSLVGGRSEDMPFPDETFDLIISHYSSPFYGENPKNIKLFFSEIGRVLKIGGEARIYPARSKDATPEKNDAINESLDILIKNGFKVEKIDGAYWKIKREHRGKK